TALGDRASEYGFAGFTVNAGADSALASLWPVNDEGTLGFMSQFYEQLGESSMLANSLRQAQISLLKGNVGIADGVVYSTENDAIATLPTLQESGQWDFSHPFYWSAFTMIGNPW
ncbi:MAG: CHAT domain-containing protein, partial [Cyanobacteria bacterium J06635_11]